MSYILCGVVEVRGLEDQLAHSDGITGRTGLVPAFSFVCNVVRVASVEMVEGVWSSHHINGKITSVVAEFGPMCISELISINDATDNVRLLPDVVGLIRISSFFGNSSVRKNQKSPRTLENLLAGSRHRS